MSNIGKKRLPFSKTVVFEFKAQLADVLTRTLRMKGSVASAILDTSAFNNGDINITAQSPYVISDVKSIVVLHSFDSFLVSMADEFGGTVTLKCQGLFVHQGSVQGITVTPIPSDQQTDASQQIRLQYLWS